eukprot:1257964-Prymnesium_polylepis.1
MENVEHGGAAKIILYWPLSVFRCSSSKNASSRKSSSASPCAGSLSTCRRRSHGCASGRQGCRPVCTGPRRARAHARAAAPLPA